MRSDRGRMRRTAVVLSAAVALTASALSLTTPTSTATPPADHRLPAGSGQQAVSLAGVAPGPHEITLITGDKVVLGEAGGDEHSLRIEPAPRPDATAVWFRTSTSPDGTYVLPSDAEPAIRAGLLDKELFNVEYLAANGYTDESMPQIPVLVSYGAATARTAIPAATALAAKADRMAATSDPVGLRSINGAGVDVDKRSTGTLWQHLRTSQAARHLGSRSPATLGSGVAKVWLDRKVTVNLAESVPLIGAPDAWNAGYDGTDVTVAVLDTGIDANHPDVAGKVAASKSFVSDTAVDGHGHGTHVAATVAGSGAASGGARKGVAPGARLLIGKVLSDAGSGTFESIIGGMEWAAAEQHADIVSMSLGACCSDGTDPASVAVNNLTATTGALFVTAAGNDGPGRETIHSPGAADAALTVAATSKTDGLAGFSGRGPRPGDLALKPEIAAPGVDIVAARAAGTTMGTPVDAHYTSARGTSMATPHVAGAAAILAQRHPDWTAAQLKAALMSTAKDVGSTVYQVGAGRLDVARAVRQQVVVTTPKLDFGIVDIPAGGTPAPRSQQVSYTNLSDQPVTLALSANLRNVQGSPVPDGTVTTAAGTLTVPAGGSAGTTVTMSPGGLPQQEYTGALVATDAATGTRLTIPIGMALEPERFLLTVRTLNRDGKPTTPQTQETLDVSGPNGTGFSNDVYVVEEGVTAVEVFPGTYSVTQLLSWVDGDNRLNGMLLTDPEITVNGDTEIVLDGRKASQIEFRTPKPAEPLNNHIVMSYQRVTAAGEGFGTDINAVGPTGAWTRLWATPTERVTIGKFRFSTQWVLGRSEVAMTVRKPAGQRLPIAVPLHSEAWAGAGSQNARIDVQHNHPGWVPFSGVQDLPLVDVGHGTAAELAGADVRGRLALLATGKTDDRGTQCGLDIDRVRAVHAAGAAGIVAYPAPDHTCAGPVPIPLAIQQPLSDDVPPKAIGIPNVALPTREGAALQRQLRAGPVTVRVAATPETPYTYVLKPYEEGRIPASLRYDLDRRDLGELRRDFHTSRTMTVYDAHYVKKPDDLTNQPMTSEHSAAAFVAPYTQTEYFGPVARDVYHYRSTYGRQGGHSAEGHVNRISRSDKGRPFVQSDDDHEQWFVAPLSPGVRTDDEAVHRLVGPDTPRQSLGECGMCRQGSWLWANFIMTTGGPDNRQEGSAGLTRANSPEEGPRDFDVHLYRGDTEIPRLPVRPLVVFDLPAEPATYRLTARSERTDADWTFRSAGPTRMTRMPGYKCLQEGLGLPAGPCAPQPLVFAGYDLAGSLTTANTVPDRGLHRFTVHAYHADSTEPMPDIAGLKLWLSYDGGTEWTTAEPTSLGDGNYAVAVQHPPAGKRASDSVSLKVEAWDAAGNRIEQVTRDAFTLTR